MLAPSKKLFHAVEAVLTIAYSSGADPVSSRALAKKLHLPPRYLELMMQKLVRAGVLRSVRGPRGGYVLAKERRRISIGEMCEILTRGEDENDTPTAATPLGNKIVKPLWHSMGEKLAQHLSDVSLADLCEKASQQNLRKPSDERADFAI